MTKTNKNVISGIFLQIAVAISGLFVPKFILQYYGSDINGLVVSINQIISYLALVEAGVGSVAIVALFKTMPVNDVKKSNQILTATKNLYFRSGIIYLVMVAGLAVVYPFLISGQVDSVLTTTLVFIISSVNVLDYFFLGKYKVLLTADDKIYIVNIFQIIVTFANAILSIVLIELGMSIVLVKSVNVILCVIRLLCIILYCKKRYPEISFKDKPDYQPLSQRWSSLVHQIAAIVVNNTDVLLITLLMGSSSLKEVSVYSIYNMVIVAISGFFGSLSSSLQAFFGKLYAFNKEQLIKSYNDFEALYYPILSVILCCVLLLYMPFISLYTGETSDVNYYRPILSVLFTFNCLIQNVRIPGVTLICAAGKFKETQYRAILEAALNIVISIALIPKFGIAGALIGTTISYLYRTTDVVIYSAKLMNNKSIKQTLKILSINIVSFSVSCFITINFNALFVISSWKMWLVIGVMDLLLATIVIAIINLMLNHKQYYRMIKRRNV